MNVDAVEKELFESYLEIAASEDWGESFRKDPDTHAKLIRTEARMDRELRRYFRLVADQVSKYVDWYRYLYAVEEFKRKQVTADDQFSVNVIVTDDGLEATNGMFMQIMFDEIA